MTFWAVPTSLNTVKSYGLEKGVALWTSSLELIGRASEWVVSVPGTGALVYLFPTDILHGNMPCALSTFDVSTGL